MIPPKTPCIYKKYVGPSTLAVLLQLMSGLVPNFLVYLCDTNYQLDCCVQIFTG